MPYDRRKGINIVVRKTNVVEQQNVRGGEGTVEFHHILKEEELYGHGKLYAKVVLKPHSSIGMHQHVGNTAVFCAEGNRSFRGQ